MQSKHYMAAGESHEESLKLNFIKMVAYICRN